jgi:HK97 gp10 family phage protein
MGNQAGGPVIGVTLEGADEVINALHSLSEELQGQALGKIALKGADVIQTLMDSKAPEKGQIEKQITKISPTAAEVAIGPNSKKWYWLFIETGARAHEITARLKQALKLYPEGPDIYAEDVPRHPGFAARPFVRPAADEAEDAAVAAAAAAAIKIIDKYLERP